jgi:hypothetical protein
MPITLRLTKGSALTHGELDGNFTHLQAAVDAAAALAGTKANASHTHAVANLTDMTLAGRNMATAPTAADQAELLPTFGATTKGMVPSSGGNAANVLHADGVWRVPAGGGGGDMLGANNLSDLTNAGVARTNLGVRPGIEVAAYSHVGAGGIEHANASGAAAGFMSAADKTKLDGVASGATANSTDSALRDRASHTGTQLAATISDFNSAARAQVEAELIAGANVTITPGGSGATRTLTIAATGSGGMSDGDKGDVTVGGSGTTLTIDNNAVTNAKAADMATATIKGRATAGTGDPEDLTPAQARAVLGLASVASSGSAADLNGTLSVARFNGGTNATASTVLHGDGTWKVPAGGGGSGTVETVAGTTYAVTSADHGKVLKFTNTSPITVTMGVAANGVAVDFIWLANTGTISVATSGGATINGGTSTIALSQAAGGASLIPVGTNAHDIVGSLGDLLAADITDSSSVGRSILTAPDEASVRTAALAAGRTQTEFGGSCTILGAIANGDFTIFLKLPHACVITETTTKLVSGTATVTPKINTTALGGSAHSATSTENSIARSSANAAAAGDDLVLTVSAGSSPVTLMFAWKYTRTLQ